LLGNAYNEVELFLKVTFEYEVVVAPDIRVVA